MDAKPYWIRDSDGSKWLRRSDGYYTICTDGRWSTRWVGYTRDLIAREFGIIGEGS